MKTRQISINYNINMNAKGLIKSSEYFKNRKYDTITETETEQSNITFNTNFGPTLNLMDIDEISTTNDSIHKNRLNVMENIRGKARSRSTSYQR